MAHTPTPWQSKPCIHDGRHQADVYNSKGRSVPLNDSNVAFIIAAVNLFDEAREALRRLLPFHCIACEPMLKQADVDYAGTVLARMDAAVKGEKG